MARRMAAHRSCELSVDPVAVQPKAFCLAVGGYPTGTSVVVWRRGVVRYVPPMSKIGDADNRLIVPTAEECAAFARVLRRIRVCDWDERYEFPEICDGTQWRLLVDWPGLARVRARGRTSIRRGLVCCSRRSGRSLEEHLPSRYKTADGQWRSNCDRKTSGSK